MNYFQLFYIYFLQLDVLILVSIMSFSILSCTERPVMIFLSWASCPGDFGPSCPFQGSLPSNPFLAVLSYQSCPSFPFVAVLFWWSCPGCPVLAFLSWLFDLSVVAPQ
jgi:hypothetical protein